MTPPPSQASRRWRGPLVALALVCTLAPAAILFTAAGRARAYRILLAGPEGVREWAIDRLAGMGPAGVAGLFEALETEEPTSSLSFYSTVEEHLIDGRHADALPAYVAVLESRRHQRSHAFAVELLGGLVQETVEADAADELAASRLLTDAELSVAIGALLRFATDPRAEQSYAQSQAVGELLWAPLPLRHLEPGVRPLVEASDPDGLLALGCLANACEAALEIERGRGEPELWGDAVEAARFIESARAVLPEIVTHLDVIGDPDDASVDVVRGMLRDVVRLLDALGQPARAAAIAALDDDRPRVRVRAALWLTAPDDPYGWSAPLDFGDDDDEPFGDEVDPEVDPLPEADRARALAVLLDDIGADAVVVAEVGYLSSRIAERIQLLIDEDDPTRGAAIQAGFDAIRGALADERLEHRRAALGALGMMAWDPGETPPALAAEVLPLLEDDDARVRHGAIRLLGRCGLEVEEPLVGLLVGLLVDRGDGRTRHAALVALSISDAELGLEALPAIRAGLGSPEFSEREEATDAIRSLEPSLAASLLPAVIARLDDGLVLEGGGGELPSNAEWTLLRLGPLAVPELRAAADDVGELSELIRRIEAGEGRDELQVYRVK